MKEAARPFDLDELPIATELTEDERELIKKLPPEAFLPGGGYVLDPGKDPRRDHDDKPRRGFLPRFLSGRLSGSS